MKPKVANFLLQILSFAFSLALFDKGGWVYMFSFPHIALSLLRINMSSELSATVNDQRTAREADLLSDFRSLQYHIAGALVKPEDESV